MKKSFFLTICTVALAVCFSCVSAPPVILLAEDGSNVVFMRPTNLRKTGRLAKSATFDLTLKAKDGELLEEPVLNYTIDLKRNDVSRDDEISLSLVFGDEMAECPVVSKEKMFRKVDKNEIHSRFSVRLDKDFFANALAENSKVCVKISAPDCEDVFVKSKALNAKIADLRLTIE